MAKFLIAFYLFTFSVYVWFSRVPDWFESETIAADVKTFGDENFAEYTVKKRVYQLPVIGKAAGSKVDVIYNPTKPGEAKIYSLFGYWIDWKEVLISLGILFVGHYAAQSIVANPSKQDESPAEEA